MTHPALKQLGSELPEHWLLALEGDAVIAEQLQTTWQLLQQSPMQAAVAAEALWLQVAKQKGLAPWLVFVMVITARIHTLSRFDTFDPLLLFFENNRTHLVACDAACREIDACYFGALVFRHPSHSEIRHWADVCLAVFEQAGDITTRLRAASYLLIFRIWSGDLLNAEVLRQRMLVLREHHQALDVRLQLLCHSTSAMCLRLFIDYQACLDEIEAGLALARISGVHEWNSHFYMQGAYLALCRENLDEAGQWLKKMEAASMPECYLDRSGYHHAMAWWHMLKDDEAFAFTHAKEAVRLAQLSGAVFPQAVVHVALAQVYMDQQHPLQAFQELGRMRRIGRALPQQHALPFIRGLIHAHVCFKMNMHNRGLKALKKAFAIGNTQRYVNFPWWRSEHMAELCARALEAYIEPEYCRWLIRQRRLTPPQRLQDKETWYWPLRIELFDGARILLDDEELQVGGKLAQMLLFLACLGGRNAWVSRVRVADLLWPDSEGDKAQRSLDTSIHRLRRQLHSEAMIQTRTGFVRLNPGLVQVDWERYRQQLDTTENSEQLMKLLLEMLERLPQMPWELAELLDVEHIKRRIGHRIFMLLSTELSTHHKVAEWAEEALKHLPENERLWRLLIKMHLDYGYPSAALDTWERYKAELIQLGIEPSEATAKLLTPWLSQQTSLN